MNLKRSAAHRVPEFWTPGVKLYVGPECASYVHVCRATLQASTFEEGMGACVAPVRKVKKSSVASWINFDSVCSALREKKRLGRSANKAVPVLWGTLLRFRVLNYVTEEKKSRDRRPWLKCYSGFQPKSASVFSSARFYS